MNFLLTALTIAVALAALLFAAALLGFFVVLLCRATGYGVDLAMDLIDAFEQPKRDYAVVQPSGDPADRGEGLPIPMTGPGAAQAAPGPSRSYHFRGG